METILPSEIQIEIIWKNKYMKINQTASAQKHGKANIYSPLQTYISE